MKRKSGPRPNRNFLINRYWTGANTLIKDSAQQHMGSDQAEITLTGEVARHPQITLDAFTLLACHEVGHHLGGRPRQKLKLNRWSSVEGQADYWAVNKCVRRLWQQENNELILSKSKVPSFLRTSCRISFPEDKKGRALCQRSGLAALSVAAYFNDTSSKSRPIDPMTPEQTIVIKTRNSYGSNQCRLDTFLLAAFCPVDHSTEEICGDKTPWGRPTCWYRPKKRKRDGRPFIGVNLLDNITENVIFGRNPGSHPSSETCQGI